MVEAADRVLRVLQAFGPHERDVSLGDLAQRVGLPKSSVHRLLVTLVGHGFVERDPSTRRYRLGVRLFELGSTVIHERGLHSAAHPVLEELSASTGETCHLAILSGLEAVYVYKVDGNSSITMSSRVGGRAPCHATSIGKVLTAWVGEDVLRQLRGHRLRAYTDRTITSARALEAELARVREQGYALDLEELEEGLRCVAAPVRDGSGRVVAALGIAGPRRRFQDGHLDRVVPPVVQAAARLSRNLGYVEVGAVPAAV
ncbi:MAG: IclR family transcriptional regulator [Candidatus Dormibacteraeota bacterium]|nr:IclR family transcriptional regulator [Candidatus Dormibacteraeota bacterium]